MKMTQEVRDGVKIVRIEGRLDSVTAAEFGRTLAELVRAGERRFALDIAAVDYVSSAGLRELMLLAKQMKAADGRVALFRPTEPVRELLRVAGFSLVIQAFAEEAALRAYLAQANDPAAVAGAPGSACHLLSVAEELFLLALDETTGALKPLSKGLLGRALAGAALMELALLNRVDVDLKELRLAGRAPTGDSLLDAILDEIAAAPAVRSSADWLDLLAHQGVAIQERVRDRLIRKKILQEERNRLIRAFQAPRQSVLKEGEIKDVKIRLRDMVFSPGVPDPRDVLILSLAAACKLLDGVFTPVELERVKNRIAALAQLDLIGHEVAEAIFRIGQGLDMEILMLRSRNIAGLAAGGPALPM